MNSVYGYYWDGILLYVGLTKDVKKRHTAHKKNKAKNTHFFYEFLRQNYIDVDDLEFVIYKSNMDRWEAWKYEKKMIKTLKPLCNSIEGLEYVVFNDYEEAWLDFVGYKLTNTTSS